MSSDHRVVLDAELGAVPRSRAWLASVCPPGRLTGRSQHVADLLISELVANAVLHAHGDVTLDLRVDPQRVEVRVSDASSEPPVRRKAAASATGGRGVALVDVLSSSWGVDPLPHGAGKTVWFQVEAPRAG